MTSDAGLLPLRQFDERWGYTARLAGLLADTRRDPEHPVVEMVRQRLLGILADDEDCSDHDDLMRVVDRLRAQRPDIAVHLAGHWPRMTRRRYCGVLSSRRRLAILATLYVGAPTFFASAGSSGVRAKCGVCRELHNGADGARTRDLCLAKAPLSQLSYRPKERPIHAGRRVWIVVRRAGCRKALPVPDQGRRSRL